jgi:hypothetical protein
MEGTEKRKKRGRHTMNEGRRKKRSSFAKYQATYDIPQNLPLAFFEFFLLK